MVERCMALGTPNLLSCPSLLLAFLSVEITGGSGSTLSVSWRQLGSLGNCWVVMYHSVWGAYLDRALTKLHHRLSAFCTEIAKY